MRILGLDETTDVISVFYSAVATCSQKYKHDSQETNYVRKDGRSSLILRFIKGGAHIIDQFRK
jgi:hypothetical protein